MIEIHLTGYGGIALVDDDDHEWLSKWTWSRNHNGYAIRSTSDGSAEKRIAVFMHKAVMGNPKDMQVDHINRNKLDNQKCNLRLATWNENAQNRTVKRGKMGGYKGVFWHKRALKWQAIICKDHKTFHLGTFLNPHEAAVKYNEAAAKLFGEFAALNIIREA